MKILVLTSTYSRWLNDTEPRFVDNLCHYLAEQNEIHVLAPHYPGSKTEEHLGHVRVTRFRYFFPAPWKPWPTAAEYCQTSDRTR